MTDEIYKELKERLEKDGYIVKKKAPIKGELKLKEMHFLEEAYRHFRYRQDELYKNSKNIEYILKTYNLCLISYGWDNIRHLVCWSYGTSVIYELPDDKREEINTFAIRIIDHLFDQYQKIWEET